ncbi:hypothetical protein [Methylobacterium isbiliense]|uniref:hypothetical protein n=1 Tax=Methylobacterium isbiliense TaxID=315478 RepID=UPI0025B4907C|nr:hypothetical protein [Methylobacterium isbiliense]MDN3624490.1 hypothetical protein [Methylobacterium isbiliense]
MGRMRAGLLAAAIGLGTAVPAEAFWVARGWRGVTVGGFRAPLAAREAILARCWRCAPIAAAAAGAAGGAEAVAAALAAEATPAEATPAEATPAEATPAKRATAAAKPAAGPSAETPSGGGSAAAGPSAATAPAGRTQVAQANSASTHCAAGLPAESKMIYDAALRNMKSLETLRDTVVAETRSLVETGRIPEAEARPAAEKAGTCLRLLAHP